jgi:hypothetical protein
MGSRVETTRVQAYGSTYFAQPPPREVAGHAGQVRVAEVVEAPEHRVAVLQGRVGLALSMTAGMVHVTKHGSLDDGRYGPRNQI